MHRVRQHEPLRLSLPHLPAAHPEGADGLRRVRPAPVCALGLMVYCENKRCGALQFFQNTKCTACGKKIKAKIGGR